MKTILNIADEKAKEYGFDSVDSAIRLGGTAQLYQIMLKAAKEHAKQVAEYQREACAYNAETTLHHSDGKKPKVIVNKKSILNTPLVTDKI